MASWTDSIPQFNPYVQQLPVEAMVQVGMQKQKMYDENVQKIQSYVDSIGNLSMLRDVDKAYLQTKINELGGKLNLLAGADFSNSQLVTSVGGMTNQLVKDKYVRSAVQSAEWHKKQQQYMEEARKKGTLTPANELHYNKQLNNYLTNNSLSTEDGGAITFNGSYRDYFDWEKFARETFDAVKPDEFSFDQVYVTDANGKPVIGKDGKPVFSPVMVRMEKEGRFPEKVKQTLEQIFSDPRVGQQLQIDGEYNYRNSTPDTLFTKIDQQRTASLSKLDQAILDLNLKKNNGQNVTAQIDDLMKKRDILLKNYQDYANLATDNPDAVRGQLYKDDVTDRYTTMFGQMKTKETYMENPGWKANWEMIKEANEQSRFAQRLQFDMQKHVDDLNMEMLKLRAGKGGRGGKGTTGAVDENGMPLTEQADQSTLDVVKKLETDYDNSAAAFKAGSDEFIWQSVYAGQEKNENALKRRMSSGISRDAAISSIIDENARQAGVSPEDYRTTWGDKGVNVYNRVAPKDRTPKMVEAYNSYTSSKKNFSTMRSMYKDFGLDDVKIDAVGVPIKYNGKDLVLSKSDITDLAIYSQGEASTFGTLVGVDPTVRLRSKQALARLKSKGLEDVADQIMRTVTSVPKYSKEPITGIMRGLRQGISNIIPEMSTSDQAIVASSVGMVLDKLNSSEYMDGLTSRVAAIQNKYGILPNRKGKLLTGDSETDKQTVYDIRRIAGAYNSGQRMNMSGDFSGFLENLPTSNKLDEIGLEYQVTLDANSNPLVEVVLYDNKGERAGGMTLQPDEAYNNFGININNLYEPPTVSLLKNYISSKGNKTSDGPVNEKSTYRSGDSYFQKEDFPNLSNLNDVDVQVNYEKFNGKYFPYVYVNNGKVDNIVPLSGMEDLNSSLSGLQSIMGPDFIQKVLNAAK